ncbi:hypothetical protein [Roseovarius autotrophicus]|uniref:hypothetical protein n=1 Tax=Roseovarius autotrophicus TaxID=2824121 RepID=UPI00300C7B1E
MGPHTPGVIARAILIAIVVATPALLLPFTDPETAQMVMVLALLAAILTFIEYNSRYPSIIEFRFAPPINRLKFFTLATILITLSLMMRGQVAGSPATIMLTQFADGLGAAVDFPYSPIRLMVLILPPGADQALIDQMRRAAGLSYTTSLVMILIFLTLVRFHGWPSRKDGFNVWVNMPLFDPTGGGDVVRRLGRDAALNMVLGFLLPFLIPAIIGAASNFFDPATITNPHTLIWATTAWAFLPASLLMRGIAMSRIAAMIDDKRQRTYAAQGAEPASESAQRA